MTSAVHSRQNWLWGPSRDLLFGCGVGYMLLFVVLVFAGPSVRALQPLYLAPLLMLLLSTPHYGATLLRVYEQRSERRAYAFFTVWTTLALLALFVWGIRDAAVGTVLFTVYLTWSPWHYTGQNYGIAVMFMRRRGVDPDSVKRWLYSCFILSFALTFLVMHQAVAPVRGLAEGGVHLARLGIPLWFSSVAIPTVAGAWLVAVIGTGRLLLRGGSLRDLLPVGLLVLSQALWFTVPDLARYWGAPGGIEALDFDYRAVYFNWVVIAHAVQYLWITSYYARAESGWAGSKRYFGKVLLAGNVVWLAPALLFSPQILGGSVSELTVGLLVASLVNLHHFVLDGAIWKLRKSKIADVLIRARSAVGKAGGMSEGAGWPTAKVFWMFASLLLVIAFAEFAVQRFGLPLLVERGEYARAEKLLDGLAWAGRDSAIARAQMARVLAEAGKNVEAVNAYTRSGKLTPDAGTFSGLAELEFKLGRLRSARGSAERGIALAPMRPDILSLAGDIELALGSRETARGYFERALRVAPGWPGAIKGLAQVNRRGRNGNAE